MINNAKKIAFQGMAGAYSDLACRTVFQNLETLPCASFDEAFECVKSGQSGLAMIPVDNSLAGRVADVHHLLPDSELYIIGEHFQPVRHALLGVKGSKIGDLEYVHSHIHALPQCRKLIKKLGLDPRIHADTAGAAAQVAEKMDKKHGAIASTLAAQIYDLEILQENVQDAEHNTTRFLILAPEPQIPEYNSQDIVLTSLIFSVRNIPAVLYKCMGGFATNGLNMTKLESYVNQSFQAAQFYCDIEGHPDETRFKLALEELGFYAKDVRFLGTYKAHESRRTRQKEFS